MGVGNAGAKLETIQQSAKFFNNAWNVLLSYLVKSLIECARVVVRAAS